MMQVWSSSGGLTVQDENFWQFLAVFLQAQKIWTMIDACKA